MAALTLGSGCWGVWDAGMEVKGVYGIQVFVIIGLSKLTTATREVPLSLK